MGSPCLSCVTYRIVNMNDSNANSSNSNSSSITQISDTYTASSVSLLMLNYRNREEVPDAGYLCERGHRFRIGIGGVNCNVGVGNMHEFQGCMGTCAVHDVHVLIQNGLLDASCVSRPFVGSFSSENCTRQTRAEEEDDSQMTITLVSSRPWGYAVHMYAVMRMHDMNMELFTANEGASGVEVRLQYELGLFSAMPGDELSLRDAIRAKFEDAGDIVVAFLEAQDLLNALARSEARDSGQAVQEAATAWNHAEDKTVLVLAKPFLPPQVLAYMHGGPLLRVGTPALTHAVVYKGFLERICLGRRVSSSS